MTPTLCGVVAPQHARRTYGRQQTLIFSCYWQISSRNDATPAIVRRYEDIIYLGQVSGCIILFFTSGKETRREQPAQHLLLR